MKARTTTMMAATTTAVGGSGGEISGEVSGVARSVAWLVAVFFAVGCLALTYPRNCTDTFGNKFIPGSILFGMSGHAE
jgi:hypothetical protein